MTLHFTTASFFLPTDFNESARAIKKLNSQWNRNPSIYLRAFLLSLGLLVSGCGMLPEAATNAQSQSQQTVGRKGPTPVDVAIAQSAKVDSEPESTGTTSPVRQVSLRSQVAPQQTLTARRASYLILQNPQTRSANDQLLLHRLVQQNPTLTPAIEFAQRFAQLVRQRQPKQLDLWLQQAEQIEIEPFQRFAKSLQEDYAALKAGVTLAVSHGQVEGQVNRLKMLKRQMYGRAGIELLSRRFLLAS